MPNQAQRHDHLVKEYNALLSVIQNQGVQYEPAVDDPEKEEDIALIQEINTMKWLARTPH